MPNAKVLAQKQEDAKNLKEKFDKSKLVILADYRGINVEDITKIRADLRKTDCEYLVAKVPLVVLLITWTSLPKFK